MQEAKEAKEADKAAKEARRAEEQRELEGRGTRDATRSVGSSREAFTAARAEEDAQRAIKRKAKTSAKASKAEVTSRGAAASGILVACCDGCALGGGDCSSPRSRRPEGSRALRAQS